ncbi:MAG: glycosyltransferase family 25 protein [Alphaproteobacteria bacterium]|nr:glycosyltransferase family 25 protein [Alphaproteobacteria bacterium]
MQFFVINLDREAARLKDFLEANQGTGIAFTRFPGVNGASLGSLQSMPEIVTPEASAYTKASVGAALSHLALWRECVRQGQNIAIFEDDARLRFDLLEQLAVIEGGKTDWDFLLLGCNTDSVMEIVYAPGINFAGQFSILNPTEGQINDIRAKSGSVNLCRLKMAFGGCGYLITPKGARMLIEHCFPMDGRAINLWPTDATIEAYGIDCMMVGVYPQMNAYTCIPPLAISRNFQINRVDSMSAS